MSKHLLQESSLLENMNELALLKPESCYVEFGAGRGGLSRAVFTGLGTSAGKATFLLIDRAGNRKKVDSKLKAEAQNVTRLKVDVKDLNLTQVSEIQHKRLVFIGKHMCGGGTDVSLKCALHLEQRLPPGESPVEGIVIALCCHHRCTWNSYANKPYIEKLGLTRKDFDVIAKLSTWATCGRRLRDENSTQAEEEGGEDEHEHDQDDEGFVDNTEGPSPKRAKLTEEQEEEG